MCSPTCYYLVIKGYLILRDIGTFRVSPVSNLNNVGKNITKRFDACIYNFAKKKISLKNKKNVKKIEMKIHKKLLTNKLKL